MRALTIWQPWASLIMIGAKPFEFRKRSYFEYRDPPKPGDRIGIHAGARPIRWKEVYDLIARCKAGGEHTGLIVEKAMPLLERLMQASKCRGVISEGAMLGTATIGRPRNAGEIFKKRTEDSDRGEFNWAWPLSDLREWIPPVPVRGAQGFWRYEGEIPEEPTNILKAG